MGEESEEPSGRMHVQMKMDMGGGAVAGLHAKCGIVDRKRQRGRGDVV